MVNCAYGRQKEEQKECHSVQEVSEEKAVGKKGSSQKESRKEEARQKSGEEKNSREGPG
jgi:hypothetical protein